MHRHRNKGAGERPVLSEAMKVRVGPWRATLSRRSLNSSSHAELPTE